MPHRCENRYIIIEPDSGEYFIDEDKKVAMAKSRSQHPGKKCIIIENFGSETPSFYDGFTVKY